MGEQDVRGRLKAVRFFRRERLELKVERLTQDREALCDRRASGQHAFEIRIRPNRGKQDADVGEAIAIHDPGQQAERQIRPVHGMRCEKRVARLELDCPKTVEFTIATSGS
jgi:hypothetical protein